MTPPRAWSVVWSEKAAKKLCKLDFSAQKAIKSFIDKRLMYCQDPRLLGKPLTGPLKGVWSYRVGRYRLGCEFQDRTLMITVVTVGHRKNVHKVYH